MLNSVGVGMPGRSTKGHEFESLSYKVIGPCIDVQRQLGLHGMEVDYQRALELALPKKGLEFEREVDVGIVYEGFVVSKRRVDFVVSDGTLQLLLETKWCIRQIMAPVSS